MLRATLRATGSAAAAATAFAVQKLATEAQAQAPPSLRNLHEALITTPLGRRYTGATPLGGSSWALSFSTSDLRSKTSVSQVQVVDIDASADKGGNVTATLTVDAKVSVARSIDGLELRQSTSADGKKLAVELWLPSGVRVARREVDGVGPKVLPAGVFGKPSFSPSGSAVALVAERLPAGADAKGYWPPSAEPTSASAGPTSKAEASDETGVKEGKYALAGARSTGEALLVHGSLLVVWDWKRDVLKVRCEAGGGAPRPDPYP